MAEPPLADPGPRAAGRVALFTAFIARFRWPVVLIATALAFVAAVRTVLTYAALRSDMEELLPQEAPSVTALAELRRRLPGLRHLGIVIDTGSPENLPAAARFIDDLASRIEKYPGDLVGAVRKDVRAEREFVETFALQLARPADVRALLRAARAPGDAAAPRELGLEALEAELAARFDLPPPTHGDRFVSPDGKTSVLLVQTASHATGQEGDARLIARVRSDVKALGFPEAYARGMRLGFAGDVATRVEETEGLASDLIISGLVVWVLVVASVLIYYRSFWALGLLGLPLTYGALYSFGVVALPPLDIRSLNSNTAFLGSIVVGNGINGGIMLLARYWEARREGGLVQACVEVAVANTWRPTLAAAGAAAAAYASLIFTQARGFNQFGWIGGFGLMLCWLANFTIMPALLLILGERVRVRRLSEGGRRPSWQRAIIAHPGVVLSAFSVLAALSVLGLFLRRGDFVEFDFSRLRRADSWETGERYWGKRMDAALGRYLTPTVVMTASAEEARIVEQRLQELAAAGGAGRLIGNVRSIFDLLPAEREQSRSEALLLAQTVTPRLRQALSERERTLLDRALSPHGLAPLRVESVPAALLTGLREKEGSFDRNVLVFPKLGGATWEGARLFRFTHDVRAAATFGREQRPVAGPLLLSTDISRAMLSDGPRATLISLASTLAICWLAFRAVGSRRAGSSRLTAVRLWLATMLSVFAGVLLMLGSVAWLGEKLNFAAFVALPITFGIAADYSINMLKRFQIERRLELGQALSATSGAVTLCSITTIIGFASLVMAQNRALFSFGVFAIAGEFTCLAVAIFGLPAALAWSRRSKRDRWEAGSGVPSDATAG